MWVIMGHAFCKIASTLGHWRLYTAFRHSFRSNRPGLFLQYWRKFR